VWQIRNLVVVASVNLYTRLRLDDGICRKCVEDDFEDIKYVHVLVTIIKPVYTKQERINNGKTQK
jgi:hypothetical protein